MEIFRSASAMQKFALEQKKLNKTIAVVPTMGYLHAGHMSLVDIAKTYADVVIVTIFVNPTQFAPNEDLASYPRDIERDKELCCARGVCAIFVPTELDMYALDFSTYINEDSLSMALCGKNRPIHFRGVCTVVAKLFNITCPEFAVFGSKDAQQALIIQRMVRDLNFPLEVVIAPLIRDKDGLALSSRNKYLSELERSDALVISKSLQAAEIAIKKHGLDVVNMLLDLVHSEISKAHGVVDYVECLDTATLREPDCQTGQILFAVAAKFGKTRLIDNFMLKLEK